jgi:hypothetical protein
LIARLLSPASRSVQFQSTAVFDPQLGQFRFRFVNDSALTPTGTSRVRLPAVVSPFNAPHSSYTGHFRVFQESDELPPLRQHSVILVTTKPIQDDGKGIDLVFGVHDIELSPGHLSEDRSIWVDLVLQFPIGGPQLVSKEFPRNSIFCGTFPNVTDRKGQASAKDWAKFNSLSEFPAKNGRACLECRFRPNCFLPNKRDVSHESLDGEG